MPSMQVALVENGQQVLFKRMRAAGFTEQQICIIANIVDSTCSGCYDADLTCHCRNDD